MGAEVFYTTSVGSDAAEAFYKAAVEARYENGHGGYTGTIAEKNEFVMIDVPLGASIHRYADSLITDDDPRVSDKWGPAGCIALGDNKYLFFGWASS